MMDNRFFWTASLGALSLMMITTAMTIWWLGGTEPVLVSLTVIATAFALITWSVKLVWKRTTLIFWGFGTLTVVNVATLAESGGSAWAVWSIGIASFAAIVFARYMEFLSGKGVGPGFEPAQERRARGDLALLALNGTAFYAAAIVIALLLFLTVPLLTLQEVSVWLIGLLGIGFIVLLTWLARSEPS